MLNDGSECSKSNFLTTVLSSQFANHPKDADYEKHLCEAAGATSTLDYISDLIHPNHATAHYGNINGLV